MWTCNQNEEDGSLDSFQSDEVLRTRKKVSYVQKLRDAYRNLGPASKAHSATVVVFGSLFTAPYKGSELLIDIHESRGDRWIQSLIEKIEFIPFVPAITNAGKKYASRIKSPFLCAQLAGWPIKEPLKDYLFRVAERARNFATKWDCSANKYFHHDRSSRR